MALAAGYTAAGPAHVGACQVVMGDFTRIVATAPSHDATALGDHARATLEARLAAGERVAGFGHPLFRQDPRNPHLRELVRSQGIESPYLTVYDAVATTLHERRNLHPNIDAMAAAIFLTLGIAPAYGTALFLCARMAAMLAHIEEARQQPAFGGRGGERRAMLAG
jgi:citrate synthase